MKGSADAMKFVLGKSCKSANACWYLVLDCRDAEEAVVSILRANSARFAIDAHESDIFATLALTSMLLAVQIDSGTHDRGGYYVNRNGDMCSSLVEVLEERDVDTWPDVEKITTFRWPYGKHYYVKVDGVNLEWEGKTKWNTHKAAREAAEAFIKFSGC